MAGRLVVARWTCSRGADRPGCFHVTTSASVPRRRRSHRPVSPNCSTGRCRRSSSAVPDGQHARPFPDRRRGGTGSPMLALRLDRHDPIAIVGVGCRFPGGVSSLDELWDFLEAGRSGIREVPIQRWSRFADGSPADAADRRDHPLGRLPGGRRRLRRGVLRDPGRRGRQDGPPAAAAPRSDPRGSTTPASRPMRWPRPAPGVRRGLFAGVLADRDGRPAGVDAWSGTGGA